MPPAAGTRVCAAGGGPDLAYVTPLISSLVQMRACLVWTIMIPQPAAVATREIGLAAAATRTVGAQAWRVGVRKTLHGTVVNAVQGRGKDTFFFLFPVAPGRPCQHCPRVASS